MRVFRTILGMLLLTIGLPALLVGAALWTTMQHRDAGGAFTATLQNVATPGYAVVVDDLDALLDEDAPFVLTGDTRLRLTARTNSGPAFIGIAPAGEAARYLKGVSHSSVDAVDIGTGTLPVRSTRVVGSRAPANVPTQQGFWQSSDIGQLDFNPSQLRDRDYSLIIMNADAQPGIRLQSTAEVRPAWLNTAAWGLLVLGSVFIIVGMMVLAWPSRRREVFFVVEPSQVPELAKRMGAPLAIGSGPAGHTGSHRPRTLADANTAGTTWPKLNPPPALPQLTWPPAQGGPTDGAEAPVARPMPAGPSGSTPVTAPAAETVPAPQTAQAGSAAQTPSAAQTASVAQTGSAAQTGSGARAAANDLASAAAPIDLSKVVAASAGSAAADLKGAPADLSKVAAGGKATAGPLIGGRPLGDRARHRPTEQPAGERQVFEASAVEAWVAETAAARARDVDARAAAILATEDNPTGTPTPAVPAGTTTPGTPQSRPASLADVAAAPAGPAGTTSGAAAQSAAAGASGAPLSAPAQAGAAARAASASTASASTAAAPVASAAAASGASAAAGSTARVSAPTPASALVGDQPAIRPAADLAAAPAVAAPAAAAPAAAAPAVAAPAASAAAAADPAAAVPAAPAAPARTAATKSSSVFDKPFEATLTKAAVSKAGLSKLMSAPLPPEDPDDEPTGSVLASRVPAAERRRSRRLSEDLAAAAEAALAGSSGAGGVLDSGKSGKPEAKPDATKADALKTGAVPNADGAPKTDAVPVGEQRTKEQSSSQQSGISAAAASLPDGGRDSAVPVARTSEDREAELTAAPAAAAPAIGGRRRKAVDAEPGGKATRSTRRSGQSRQSGKG
jgi:hypothetical protein